jgi:hypothetical protein
VVQDRGEAHHGERPAHDAYDDEVDFDRLCRRLDEGRGSHDGGGAAQGAGHVEPRDDALLDGGGRRASAVESGGVGSGDRVDKVEAGVPQHEERLRGRTKG